MPCIVAYRLCNNRKLTKNGNLEISLSVSSISTELCHKNSMLGSQNGPLKSTFTSTVSCAIPNV